MISFYPFLQTLTQEEQLRPWLETLPKMLQKWREEQKHDNLPKWEKVLEKLPELEDVELELQDGMRIGEKHQLSDSMQAKLHNLLQVLHPWRKGPYQVFDTHIDTEWRSDWKWDRLVQHISPLQHRMVLDVGCGNGYHMWRILGAGARRVVGVDPSSLFLCQFEVIKKLTQRQAPVDLLPFGLEVMPGIEAFDTVFSMGVLYHRRSPIDHILQLKQQLRAGGELVLETLVVEGDATTVLIPEDRYAKMHNVWCFPSVEALKVWLRKCSFKDIRLVSLNQTSVEEQRTTPWMRNESLIDFLDPEDHNKTIEGHPAPLRATLVATKP